MSFIFSCGIYLACLPLEIKKLVGKAEDEGWEMEHLLMDSLQEVESGSRKVDDSREIYR